MGWRMGNGGGEEVYCTLYTVQQVVRSGQASRSCGKGYQLPRTILKYSYMYSTSM